MTQRAPVVPCHYHLSKESWAEVVEAYRNGATARELAVKWKVAPGSVYYHAGREGWSKKRNGDERARAHARAVEEAEAVRAEPQRREQRALKNLFAPPPADDPDASDPAALARAAILGSGRAMKDRLWNEARALAGLAESYARLGERARGGGATVGTMDLRLLAEVLADEDGTASRRLDYDPDRQDDPDRAVKLAYQERMSARRQEQTHHHMAMVRRIHANEAEIRRLGGTVTVSQSSFDAMALTRDWLLAAAEELEDVAVTPSPPRGDPWAVGM